MTDDEILDRARSEGFDLVERACGDQWVHGWARGGDERWPCYLTRAEAVAWMADRQHRIRVFA